MIPRHHVAGGASAGGVDLLSLGNEHEALTENQTLATSGGRVVGSGDDGCLQEERGAVLDKARPFAGASGGRAGAALDSRLQRLSTRPYRAMMNARNLSGMDLGSSSGAPRGVERAKGAGLSADEAELVQGILMRREGGVAPESGRVDVGHIGLARGRERGGRQSEGVDSFAGGGGKQVGNNMEGDENESGCMDTVWVMGGWSGSQLLATTEYLDTRTSQWVRRTQTYIHTLSILSLNLSLSRGLFLSRFLFPLSLFLLLSLPPSPPCASLSLSLFLSLSLPLFLSHTGLNARTHTHAQVRGPSLPTARRSASSVAIGRWLFVFGGWDGL